MKLHYSPTSPYVRKIMILAHETGLIQKIETVRSVATPHEPNMVLGHDNPLIKVPTLVLDTGEIFYDSPVIAEYLDSVHGGRRFFPAEGPERWRALKLQATGDGILDAGLLCRYELLRPEAQRWTGWVEGQMTKIHLGVAQFDQDAAHFAAQPTIGEIAAGATIGYLDFRFPELGWRKSHPRLADWYAGFAERPSMQATRPPEA
jgi:glutathione S-transferase